VLPELAFLAPEFKEACGRDKFVQADASRERRFVRSRSGWLSVFSLIATALTESLGRVFDRSNGAPFDYVFNCGGETKYSQDDQVYQVRSHALSLAVGREAAKRKVGCFVECSTGMVYKPDSSPRKETDKLKPWLKLAKWKLQAEEDLVKVAGLNLVVLRLAHVYGPYTSKFLGTALCMARVYQELQLEMKWLWGKDLRTNTVHVDDTVKALWAAAEWYTRTKPDRKAGKPPTFNIVDRGNTCKLFPRRSVMRQSDTARSTRDSGNALSQSLQHYYWLSRYTSVLIRAPQPRPRGG